MKERVITTLGLRTRVFEVGGDSDEAIVFVHGGPGSADDWREYLPAAGELGRAVAFDLPGFGSADKPTNLGYSAATWATYIQGALVALGIRRVHLVANDLGCESALAWAAAHPDAFASAVMVNSGPLIRYRWHAVGLLHRLPILGGIAATVGRIGFRPVMRFYAGRVPRPVTSRWLRDYDLGTRRALLSFYRSSDAINTSDLPAALAPLDRPALVIWGRKNRFVPVKHAEDLRASFPRAEIVILDGLGHYAHLEEPTPVRDHIIPFLEQQIGA